MATTYPVTTYSVGTFSQRSGYRSWATLTPAEFAEVQRQVSAVGRVRPDFTMTIVNENFRDLSNLHTYTEVLLSVGKEVAQPPIRDLGRMLMSQTVNWLTSVRLYLDHVNTDLSRRFGVGSAEQLRFEEATNRHFDSSVGYRFTYKLRNFVQHCGLPSTSVSVRERSEPHAGPLIHEAAIELSRDHLLHDYDSWGELVRADLRGFPAKFALMPLVEETMDCLKDLERLRLRTNIDSAVPYGLDLAQTIERTSGRAEDESPIIFKMVVKNADRQGTTIEHTPLDVAVVNELVRIHDGLVTADELIVDSSARRPSGLDPHTVEEHLAADTRGVQVLALFEHEGGGTPRFNRLVNRMVQEDGSVDDLVVGLLNVSVVLLHMTSAAIGANPQGLLAGMLDAYGDRNTSAMEGQVE